MPFQNFLHRQMPGISAWRGAAAVAALWGGVAVAELPAQRLEELSAQVQEAASGFRPAGDAAVESAASGLRQALAPLDALLRRSQSGPDWRDYLDWPTLEAQAASGMAADPATLRRLDGLFNAAETGLDLPEFVRVRKAVSRYAEVADTARGTGANRLAQRLGSLASALSAASVSGSAESLAPVSPILERLTASGQAPAVVAAVRGAASRPNILFEVQERLLAAAVNRPVDQSEPVDEVVLGNRVRGYGHTNGFVVLDLVPSTDRAAFDLVMAGTNVADTRGSQGPVSFSSRGITSLGARRRIFIDENTVSAGPVAASANTDSTITGLSVNARVGRKLIRKVANRKIAEAKPEAEAVAAGRAREKLSRQFHSQTEPAVAQFREQFQSRIRGPLQAQGLYPDWLHMNTTDRELCVTARKAGAMQLAAMSFPPAADAANVLTARVHESAVNNMLEDKLGGRRITQADVERIARERDIKTPESLGTGEDQKEWAITFAKHRPVSVAVDDGRLKVMVRGDKFVSGDRSFPGMDIWVTYAIGRSDSGWHLVREGAVQIYPPGFKPGGAEKLSMAETSLRRILQKRFDKLCREVIDIEDLPLQGELAAAGPLPMQQLVARKDGWLAVGWRANDRGLVR